jgi:hypothetical protein
MGDNDTLGELSVRQRRAVAALLSEPTVAAAAKVAGVSRKTLYRYLAAPTFRAALAERQGDVLRMSAARLAGMLSQALDVVGLDLGAGVAGDMRLRAAGLVLRHVASLLEYASLEERVRSLEERANRSGKNGRQAAG